MINSSISSDVDLVSACLLGECGVEVKHKRVGIPAKFSDDEGNALRHQAGDESHIARQAVQLGKAEQSS